MEDPPASRALSSSNDLSIFDSIDLSFCAIDSSEGIRRCRYTSPDRLCRENGATSRDRLESASRASRIRER
jgi:hypothetical protein